MLNIGPASQIYFMCPAEKATGGTELAHQAASQLRSSGLDANMFYYRIKGANPVPERFVKYAVPWVAKISDHPSSIVVIPEIALGYTKQITCAQKIAWWMSVDNFIKYGSWQDIIKNKRWEYLGSCLKKTIKESIRRKHKSSNRNFSLSRDHSLMALHVYQSEYAKQFLLTYGIQHIERLSDYINDVYLTQNDQSILERHDAVLYNPRKGAQVTKKLIALNPDINWIKLEGLTPAEMNEIMRTSKVYIDLGHHPGKDRIPREASVNKCIVITSTEGAARYKEDIPIDDEFKLDLNIRSLEEITNVIRYNLKNYENQVSKQNVYRATIQKEKEVFASDLRKIFER